MTEQVKNENTEQAPEKKARIDEAFRFMSGAGELVGYPKNKPEMRKQAISIVEEVAGKLYVDDSFIIKGDVKTKNEASKGPAVREALKKAGFKVWGKITGEVSNVFVNKGEKYDTVFINMAVENGQRSLAIPLNPNDHYLPTFLAKILTAEKGEPLALSIKMSGVVDVGGGKTARSVFASVASADPAKAIPQLDDKGVAKTYKNGDPIVSNPEIKTDLISAKRAELNEEYAAMAAKNPSRATENIKKDMYDFMLETIVPALAEKYPAVKAEDKVVAAVEAENADDAPADVATVDETEERPSTPKM